MPTLRRTFIATLELLILILSSVCLGCRTSGGSGSTPPTRDITLVMESHVNELMAIPGVTGVAIGELKDGTPCIQVLIVEDSRELRGKIPNTLEGHPVDIIVSGVIKPL